MLYQRKWIILIALFYGLAFHNIFPHQFQKKFSTGINWFKLKSMIYKKHDILVEAPPLTIRK
jgi:hypothetical protein